MNNFIVISLYEIDQFINDKRASFLHGLLSLLQPLLGEITE
jgi:hypothetical protein